MGEYFGFEIKEEYDNQVADLLIAADSRWHRAIASGLSQLCEWYGDKSYRELEDWYEILYKALHIADKDSQPLAKPVQLEFDYALSGLIPCSANCGMLYTGPIPVPADHPPHLHNSKPCLGSFEMEVIKLCVICSGAIQEDQAGLPLREIHKDHRN